jgi:hypothetical protein
MKKTLCFSFVIVISVAVTNAQIINVPADKLTIQAGIDSASNGDTVLVEEGTYFENIDFMGKAIVVGSEFIIDGDTSHISRTIIDGSQATDPDTASVVSFKSGEDTTSVITGFTITGGKGTAMNKIFEGNPDAVCKVGGGICFYRSGGKATFNIIEGNDLTTGTQYSRAVGSGVLARGGDGQIIVIRHNTIRNNSMFSSWGTAWGAGMGLIGGGFLVEYNTIQQNSMGAATASEGGGMLIWLLPYSKQIALFRNNIISGNQALSNTNTGFGGGIAFICHFDNSRAQLLNNVIADNYVEGYAGGVSTWQQRIDMINNTLVENRAGMNGHSLGFYEPSSDMILVNNILWSGAEDEKRNVHFEGPKTSFSGLVLCHNILDDPLVPENPVTAFDNTYMEPVFEEGSYSQAESSPGVGRGEDSVMIGDTLYVAPALDLQGNPRPHVSGGLVDIGALESSWPLQLFPEADLATIYFGTHTVEPPFQRDTLNYEMDIPDTCTSVASYLMAIPVDKLAEVLVEEPEDLSSESDPDRTATITVHSSDQSTQKSYSVLFRLLSIDASLSSLEVNSGDLEPSFDPEVLSYVDTLCGGTTETPGITYTTSDENASVEVKPATDVTSFINDLRTTKIIVTAELGTPSITYEIEFFVDPTSPCTAIPGINFTPVVKLYPNPISTHANLEIRNIEKVKSIQLVNIMGQVVRNIDYTEGEAKIIERKGLPAGLYFLRIQSDRSVIKKVLIE